MGTFLLGVVGFTSVGIYLVGSRGLGLSGRDLPAAVGKMLECVGATLVFFVVNLAVAITVIFISRGLGGDLVSLYPAGDTAWLILSLFQAVTFQWWRELSRRGGENAVNRRR